MQLRTTFDLTVNIFGMCLDINNLKQNLSTAIPSKFNKKN